MKRCDNIEQAVDVLKKGGIILYPTETVWGIGCDATNAQAVERIYKLKQRADKKSMLVLVDSLAALDRVVENVPEAAEMLLEAAVRPLTIIYDRPKSLPQNLTADDGSVGIRITSGHVANRICRMLKRPLVSTSANISGHRAPALLSKIDKEIIEGVDLIIGDDSDTNPNGRPSDIIKVSDDGVIRIIRG